MPNNKSHEGGQKARKKKESRYADEAKGKSGGVIKHGALDPKPPTSQGADKNPVDNSRSE